MKIFVKDQYGHSIPLLVPRDATRETVLSLLSGRTGVPVEYVRRLNYAGKEVPEGVALSSLGVRAGGGGVAPPTLHALWRARGGDPGGRPSSEDARRIVEREIGSEGSAAMHGTYLTHWRGTPEHTSYYGRHRLRNAIADICRDIG